MLNKHQAKGLYAITDPALLPEDSLYEGVEAALRGGVRWLQYRNKHASPALQIEQAKRLKALCERYSAKLLINDNVSLCQAVDADGVHLGRSDGSLPAARETLGADKIIGVTCHSDLGYARSCRSLGADYCAFGRIFSSQTKPEAPPCSLDVLAQACKEDFPVVAIGGITQSNMQALVDLGVDMVAVIHGLFGQADIEQSARAMQKQFSIHPEH